MITVEQHLATVLEAAEPLPSASVSLADALGRTLSADVAARLAIPGFDNSSMDGFAVRFDDVRTASAEAPVRLRAVVDLPAGTSLDPALGPGEAARIMTGAPTPSDADVIVPFEDTAGGLAESMGELTVLRAPAARGAFIRRRAADLAPGDTVLQAGGRLGPLQLAAAAAAGVTEASCHRTPRVVIVSTGDELVDPAAPPRRGAVPDSNAALLAALTLEADARPTFVTRVDDDGAALRALMRTHTAPSTGRAGVDVIIFSGGVSAGAFEVVRNELGTAMSFTKVAMQPGKPQGFGVLHRDGHGRALLFGLPGNPVSAAVSFEVFVRPALLALQGRRVIHRPVVRLPAAIGWQTPPGRRQYLPAVIDREDPAAWRVAPASAGGSGSHLAGGLGRADAYAIVPAETAAVKAGEFVDVMLIA